MRARISTLAQLLQRCRADGECLMYPETKHRYGIVTTIHGRRTAHHAAFLLNGGKLLPGQIVCHTCDRPRCCNPKHQFAGTQADNMRDRFSKGRVFVNVAGRNKPLLTPAAA